MQDLKLFQRFKNPVLLSCLIPFFDLLRIDRYLLPQQKYVGPPFCAARKMKPLQDWHCQILCIRKTRGSWARGEVGKGVLHDGTGS